MMSETKIAEQDNCQLCFGQNGGVRGNENRIGGLVVCDYCSVKIDRLTRPLEKGMRQLREALVMAKKEITASGNWMARDYGWPDVRAAINAAIADTEPKP